MTFRTGQIPFTPKNLHALRTGTMLVAQQEQQQERHQQAMALRSAAAIIDVPPTAGATADRHRDARLREYEGETAYERCMRWGPVVGIVLAVGFVGVVTVLLTIASVRMSNALDSLDGDTLAVKLDKLLDYGVASARNAHAATANVVTMTAHAADTAAMAAPRLQHAVNDTTALVDDLRSWSFHPSLAIAPGHGGG